MITPYQLHVTAHTTYPKLPSIPGDHPLNLQPEETPYCSDKGPNEYEHTYVIQDNTPS
jgi:hypothetical protein